MTQISIHGTRGSYPAGNPAMIKYGMRTSSVSISSGNDLAIIDAGTGILDLEDLHDAHILLTHQHMDHVHGLPHFAPMYGSGHISFYGERKKHTLKKSLQRINGEPYHSAPFNAQISYNEISPGDHVQIGSLDAEVVRLNHPGGAVGYLMHTEHGKVAFLWDHEPSNPAIEKNLEQRLKGVKVIIVDGMYTRAEYNSKRGWGHGTSSYAAHLGKKTGADVYFTHHDPIHTDAMIAKMEREAQRIHKRTFAAREGMKIEVK